MNFKDGERVVFTSGDDWIPKGAIGTIIGDTGVQVRFDDSEKCGTAKNRTITCCEFNLEKIIKEVPEQKPSFQDWINGFESRYTEEQLWYMKWAFEVGQSSVLKNEKSK